MYTRVLCLLDLSLCLSTLTCNHLPGFTLRSPLQPFLSSILDQGSGHCVLLKKPSEAPCSPPVCGLLCSQDKSSNPEGGGVGVGGEGTGVRVRQEHSGQVTQLRIPVAQLNQQGLPLLL